MKFLKCLLCGGELDVIGALNYEKIVKCRKCNYTSSNSKKEPEITIIKRKIQE